MTITEIPTPKDVGTINWDVSQILTHAGMFVLTNGESSRTSFEGTDLSDGTFHKNWAKAAFIRATLPITLTFSD